MFHDVIFVSDIGKKKDVPVKQKKKNSNFIKHLRNLFVSKKIASLKDSNKLDLSRND